MAGRLCTYNLHEKALRALVFLFFLTFLDTVKIEEA